MKTTSLLGTLLVLALWWPGGAGQATSCTLDNCKTCVNEALACETCQSRHVQDTSGTCIACSPNCETCSLSNGTTVCTDCDAQHFLGTDGKCNTCPQDCASCANRESCTTCQPGFRQNSVGAECQACPSDCKECDGGSKCRECRTGYYLNGGFTCTRCLSNCKVCKDGKTCEECNSAYYFDAADEKCERCVDNCANCTATGCTKCNTDYFVSGKVCRPCGDCEGTCSDTTGCDKCDPGSFKSSEGSCLDCPHNELDISSAKCAACIPKGENRVRFLNGSVCDYCPENCQVCSDRDVCTTCKDGFYKNTTHGCLACHSSCGTCDGPNSDDCIICKESNHFQSGGTCSACNDTCLTCNGATATDCLSCISTGVSKRYLDSTQCKECPTDISTMDSTQCSACAGAYVYQNPCVQCPAGCRNCKVDGTTCTECIPGYFLSGTTCTACHGDCNSTDTGACTGAAQDKCLNCDDPDMEPVDGTCTAKCMGNEFRNSSNLCEGCDNEYGDGCIKCDASRCLECTAGDRYHLFPNRTACLDCQSLMSENECTGSGVCIHNSTACIACHSSCKECTDLNNDNTAEDSECTSCYDNNLLNNGCYECHETCKTCNGPNAQDCVTCPDWSYKASDGTCTNCTDSNCVKCSKADFCDECIGSMVAIKGDCVACPSVSVQLLSSDFCNVCSKHIGSTYGSPQDSTCVKCADNCESCSAPGECSVCTDNYVLDGTTCRTADCTDPKTKKKKVPTATLR